MKKSSSAFCLVAATAALVALGPASARAACVIAHSPCYPWSIPEGEDDSVLLEIVPNNTITGAVYRVCVCPPAKGISIVFDFQENTRVLGTLTRNTDTAICRDYRFQTSRSSTLKVRRSQGDKGLVEGCYTTY